LLLHTQAVIQIALDALQVGLITDGQVINNLRFVDDIDLIAESPEDLQEISDREYAVSSTFGLKINVQNTKTMATGKIRKARDKVK